MNREDFLQMIEENRVWLTVLSVVLILTGAAAIALPHIATLSAELMFGACLAVAGVVQVIQAFGAQSWRPMLLQFAIGILYVGCGALLLANPIVGVIALTVALAATFVVEGVLRIVFGFKLRPNDGWLLVIVSGVVAIIAGVMIWAGLPATATWVIGMLVGVNMVMSGVAFLMLTFTAKDDTAVPATS